MGLEYDGMFSGKMTISGVAVDFVNFTINYERMEGHCRKIAGHRLSFHGPHDEAVAWNRWLDRCESAYNIRRMIRG